MKKEKKKYFSIKNCLAVIFSCGLGLSLLAASAIHLNNRHIEPVEAADYSGVSSGFTRGSDGSISATFTVTNNDLDMKGWLLCLFDSKPSVDGNNKLTNSNSAHPYSYSSCKHYFFASNTAKTGSITVKWNANYADQKQSWSASTSTGASGKTLNDYASDGTNWYLVIGPRHYNTSWGSSGIGEGTDGYWENCDYYVGAFKEVFPSTTGKDMSVSVTNYEGTYNGSGHSIQVKVNDPTSGYTIKYRTASSGSYNLTSNPSYVDAGTYTVYYQVSASGYNTYESYGTVKINKANPTYTAPTKINNLVYNGNNQALVSGGSSNVVYSLTGSNYTSTVPTGKNAGSYMVFYKVNETTNYNAVDSKTITVSIAKANASYLTVPSAKLGLNYTAEYRELVNPGSTNDGIVLYSLDNNSYYEDVPEKLYVGTYTVYYKIQGDSNHFNVDPESFEVSIYPNDKTALNAVIEEAEDYLDAIAEDYPAIAEQFADAISLAQDVSYEDNETIEQIADAKEALIETYNLAHSKVVDVLIDDVGDVRYSDKCLEDIEKAEEAYLALSEEQKALVNDYDDLEKARALYDKLEDVAKAIEAIGDITYDEDCYERIQEAIEAFESLSEEEQLLIPTIFNELNSDIDIYEMLETIANLGDVEYTEEFKEALEEAINAYDALNNNEQGSIYNYQDLLDALDAYNNVDEVVDLVNQIAEELSYVGTHNHDIEKAREAYESLSEEEKQLVPEEIVNALTNKEEEYEDLKVEHERKEIEDREAGVAIATEGGSGIPNTVSIDINNSQNKEQNIEDNIDYQTIQNNISEGEEISSICEIKFYEERDGEIVELSLADIDENMSVVIKLDVPEDIDPSNFRIFLLDDDNNTIEMEYTYDPETRQATVVTSKIGTFAIVTPVEEVGTAKNGLVWSILLAIIVTAIIVTRGYFWIRNKDK